MNVSDALLSQNLYTFEPKLPMILGYEVVGKLVEVGSEAEKSGYRVGDKVIALNKERYGGLAEKCLAEVGVEYIRNLDFLKRLMHSNNDLFLYVGYLEGTFYEIS